METLPIATRLIELCREGKNHQAMTELYSKDIVSVEAGAPPGESPITNGIDATMAKGQWWMDNHEVHSAKVSGPWPNGNRFMVRFEYDVTFKPTGARMMMDEIALFTVTDGKITREDFFYTMDG
jgi:ketosteroid isomerase-like protein